MTRISIDLEDETLNRIKTLAAIKGQDIEEFMVKRALAEETDEERAMSELETLLDARIAEYERSGPSSRTVEEIFQRAIREVAPGQNG